MQGPQQAADLGDPRIVAPSPDRPGFLFGVDPHRAELVHREHPAAAADPLLPEQHRTRRGRLYDHSGQHPDRQQADQHDKGDGDVDQALGRLLPGSHQPGLQLHQWHTVDLVGAHVPGDDVVQIRDDAERHRVVASGLDDLEDFLVRVGAQGDQHRLHGAFAQDAVEIFNLPQHRDVADRWTLRVVAGAHESDDVVHAYGPRVKILQQPLAALVGADDQRLQAADPGNQQVALERPQGEAASPDQADHGEPVRHEEKTREGKAALEVEGGDQQ